MRKILTLFIFFFLCVIFLQGRASHLLPVRHVKAYAKPEGDSIYLADPTIFFDKGIYYLYGTGGDVNRGFLVYTSGDLKHWAGPLGVTDGYALVKGETFGTKGFWAPQVFAYQQKYYMAYTANEQIAIAVSGSPLGPFRQADIKPLSGAEKQIDPFVFMEKGKIYLFHVRLGGGNKLYVAEMLNDLSDIKPGSGTLIVEGDQTWENTNGGKFAITEGPTVMKHKKLFYLFYSANDFRNINYAVGYAVAKTPSGPWIKSKDSPIISRTNTGFNGTGHGDFLKAADGSLYYVLHTHRSFTKVSPRITALVRCRFVKKKNAPDAMQMETNSLFFPEVTQKQ